MPIKTTPPKPHEGFKRRLLERAAERPRKYAFLKKIAQSPHFCEVETSIDNTHKGRGGVFIDQEWLITAIEQAHTHYANKAAYLSLKDKTQKLRAALKKATDLSDDLDALRLGLNLSGITSQIRHEINMITRAHVPIISKPRPSGQGLTKEHVMFCFWLAVWLFKRYRKKRFSTLIASIALCLFDGDERITAERIKNTLANAMADIEKKAANLKI